MQKLILNERFEAPIQIENVENGIFKMQETENVRIMLLDESIADKIIKLGIKEYIKLKESEEKE